jgi:radical SAM protein with 4Fe4S-binding SPASM domain
MNCRHCYSSGFRNKTNELSREEIRKIIENLNEIGIFEIFFDGGESLLRGDFIDICNYASDVGISASFSTNGFLMTNDIAKKLKKAGLKKIQVSIDGANPATHDSFRRTEGAFKRAVSCVDLLIKNEIDIVVACTITKNNYCELNHLVNLCIDWGVSDLVFTRLIHAGNAKMNADLFLNKRQLEKIYLDIIHKKIDEKKIITIRVHHNPLLVPLIKQMDIDKKMKRQLTQEATCAIGKWMCWITSTGDVTPCPAINLPLGNIRDTSLEEIWRGNEILSQLRNCKQFMENDCIKCKHFISCNGGCHADAYGTQNNLFAKDPMCIL